METKNTQTHAGHDKAQENLYKLLGINLAFCFYILTAGCV